MSTQGIDELRQLGLTDLEARIYVHLLSTNASTGYAIAKALAKPAANVYKAITTLELKGAIYIEDGKNRTCSAVPASELLDAMERAFKTNKAKASKRLNQIGKTENTNRVYSLNTPEQVYEKCIALIDASEQSILIDAFDGAIKPLQEHLNRAVTRGVQASMQKYGSQPVQGLRTFNNPAGEQVREKWPGQWLNLVVDGQNFIMAYFSRDLNQVQEALWSSSPYISWIYYSALIAEMQLSAIKDQLRAGISTKDLIPRVQEMDMYFNTDASAITDYFNKYHKER